MADRHFRTPQHQDAEGDNGGAPPRRRRQQQQPHDQGRTERTNSTLSTRRLQDETGGTPTLTNKATSGLLSSFSFSGGRRPGNHAAGVVGSGGRVAPRTKTRMRHNSVLRSGGEGGTDSDLRLNQPSDENLRMEVKTAFKLIQVTHHRETIEHAIGTYRFPMGMLRQINKLSSFIKPALPSDSVQILIENNTEAWMFENMNILFQHYDSLFQQLIENTCSKKAFQIAKAWAKKRFGARLRPSTIMTAKAHLCPTQVAEQGESPPKATKPATTKISEQNKDKHLVEVMMDIKVPLPRPRSRASMGAQTERRGKLGEGDPNSVTAGSPGRPHRVGNTHLCTASPSKTLPASSHVISNPDAGGPSSMAVSTSSRSHREYPAPCVVPACAGNLRPRSGSTYLKQHHKGLKVISLMI